MDFPNIDPVLISIGPLMIRWYALAYIAGIALGWWYLSKLIEQPHWWSKDGKPPASGLPPLNRTQLDDVLFYVTLGIILGGRLGFVLFYRPELMWEAFETWPRIFGAVPIWPPLAVWTGGMSFHGGLIGVTIATLLFARKQKLNPIRIGDLFACAAPIGLFFGRIANFINAELYGRPWDGPWAIRFPERYDREAGAWQYAAEAVPRHPSQLYEAALEGALLFVIMVVAVRRFRVLQYPGAAIGLFLAGYGASRFFVEFFREPDSYEFAGPMGFLTRGMLLSLPMVGLGLWAVWRARNRAITPS